MIKSLFSNNYQKLALAAGASIVNSILTLYVLSEIGSMISDSEKGADASYAITISLTIVCLCVVNYISGVMLSDLNTETVSNLRKSLISKILTLDYIKRESLGVDKIYAALTSDVGKLSQFVCLIPSLLYNSSVVLLCIAYMFYLSWQLSLFLLFVISLTFFIYNISTKKGFQGYLKLREVEDKMFSSFDIVLSGGKELGINSNRKSYYFNNRAQPSIDTIKTIEHKTMRYWIFSESWLMASIFFLLLSVVFFGNTIIGVTHEVLVNVSMIILFLLMPVRVLTQGVATISQAKISLDKIESLELDVNVKTVFLPHSPKENFHQLQFNNVEFFYGDDSDINATPKEPSFKVGPVNLKLEPGQIVFVTGGNGSGKTTLIKMILGLIERKKGEILFNDRHIFSADLESYRQNFSCIFQDFYLFEEVLNQNGSLVADELILNKIESFGLIEKVSSKQGELSSTKLSQGQRRRLAMILAIFEDSPIYVFDEWAADQDVEYKDYFYTELLPSLKNTGKLVIIVTHDEKYYSYCDRLLKLDNGTLSETQSSIETLVAY